MQDIVTFYITAFTRAQCAAADAAQWGDTNRLRVHSRVMDACRAALRIEVGEHETCRLIDERNQSGKSK